MKNVILLFGLFFLYSCGPYKINPKASVKLQFLDDYVIPANTSFKNTKVGGFSGIDFTGKDYLLISDGKSNPRFYRAEINWKKRKIDSVIFTELIEIKTKNNSFFKKNYLDPEAIRYYSDRENITITSEGNITRKKDPTIFSVTKEGEFLASYSLPSYFSSENKSGLRNNGVFEGLTNSLDSKGIWVAMELPLKTDGPKPMLVKTTSPVRITYFDRKTKQAQKQVVYLLEPIAKVPLKPFRINGISEILAFSPGKFLVVERGFSAGLGQHGNTIRIYLVDISNATNTLHKKNLNKKMDFIVPAKKKLLFDFDWIKNKLSQGFIDNIEGITFGPNLPNGNKSLLLISDNNFNALGPQLNQVILMELIKP